jgi:hypothetical protein
MVVRQFLVLFVLVRIQVGQQVTPRFARGIFLAGSEASSLARADGRKNTVRRQPDEVTWVMQSGANPSRGTGMDNSKLSSGCPFLFSLKYLYRLKIIPEIEIGTNSTFSYSSPRIPKEQYLSSWGWPRLSIHSNSNNTAKISAFESAIFDL